MKPALIGKLLLASIVLAFCTHHPIIAIALIVALVAYACCVVSGDCEEHLNERDSDM